MEIRVQGRYKPLRSRRLPARRQGCAAAAPCPALATSHPQNWLAYCDPPGCVPGCVPPRCDMGCVACCEGGGGAELSRQCCRWGRRQARQGWERQLGGRQRRWEGGAAVPCNSDGWGCPSTRLGTASAVHELSMVSSCLSEPAVGIRLAGETAVSRLVRGNGFDVPAVQLLPESLLVGLCIVAPAAGHMVARGVGASLTNPG